MMRHATPLAGLRLRGHVLVVLAALALLLFAGTVASANASGQPSPETLDALVAAERRVADTSASLRDRELAVDRALELRRKVIASASDDDERLPRWLLEQGPALIARLARDGTDTAVLLGIPLPSQREAAAAAGAEAAAILRRALHLLPDTPETQQDRSVRIPFFLARAELLIAGSTTGEARRHHAQAAYEQIGPIALREVAPESVRRVNVSLALLLRSQDAADAEIAIDELAWVLMREGDDARAVAPLTRAEAWLGLLHASALLDRGQALMERFHQALSRPPFVTANTADTLLIVLAHDAASRALFQQGLRTDDPQMLELAVQQQAQLLTRTDLPFRAETLRPLVYEKLAVLADTADVQVELPGAMRAARAVMLARDADRRDEAIAMLRRVCDEDSARAFAADALWELAVLLSQHAGDDPESLREASLALVRLAEHHPESPRAADAMAAALNFARSLALKADNTPLASAARETYALALEVATTHYPALTDIDLWHYERARLLLEEHQRLAADRRDFPAGTWLESALDSLQAISASSSIADDAARLAAHAHIARLDALQTEFRALRRQSKSLEPFARDRLAPAARQASAWARTTNSPLLNRFRLDLAEALIEAHANNPGSLAGPRQMVEELLPRLSGEQAHLIPRATLAHARTLIASGDPAAAFPLLRTVAQQLEPHIANGEDADSQMHELFWHAWTLMLETLAQHHTPSADVAASTPTLRVHIRRLQALDPALGGPPWQQRLLKVQQQE